MSGDARDVRVADALSAEWGGRGRGGGGRMWGLMHSRGTSTATQRSPTPNKIRHQDALKGTLPGRAERARSDAPEVQGPVVGCTESREPVLTSHLSFLLPYTPALSESTLSKPGAVEIHKRSYGIHQIPSGITMTLQIG